MSVHSSYILTDIQRRRDIIKTILERYTSQSAEEALIKAAQAADLNSIVTLFNNCALNVNTSYRGLTAIQTAFQSTNNNQRDEVIAFLLSKGANPVKPSDQGETALQLLRTYQTARTNNILIKREIYLALYRNILNDINDPSIATKSFVFKLSVKQGVGEDAFGYGYSTCMEDVNLDNLENRLDSAYQNFKECYKSFLEIAPQMTSPDQPITVKIRLVLSENEYVMDSLDDLSECIKAIREEKMGQTNHNKCSPHKK